MQQCTIAAARPCAAARSCRLHALLAPEIVRGMLDAYRHSTQAKNWKIMGTELLTVGVSVLLFGLCALFVRICDRI